MRICDSEITNSSPASTNESEDDSDHEIVCKFIVLIDEAMSQVMQLLSADSFLRFTNSDEFQKFCNN